MQAASSEASILPASGWVFSISVAFMTAPLIVQMWNPPSIVAHHGHRVYRGKADSCTGKRAEARALSVDGTPGFGYTHFMDSISPEIAREIERRLDTGRAPSPRDLLRHTRDVLEAHGQAAPEWLEEDLQRLEGDLPKDAVFWARFEGLVERLVKAVEAK